jgi:hypothetical protein
VGCRSGSQVEKARVASSTRRALAFDWGHTNLAAPSGLPNPRGPQCVDLAIHLERSGGPMLRADRDQRYVGDPRGLV